MTGFAVGDGWVDTTLRLVRDAQGERRLSERDVALVDALVAGGGRPVPAATLQNVLGDGTDGALMTAITRLRRKLQPDSSVTSALRAVRNEGYALDLGPGRAPLPGIARTALLGRDTELTTLDREARRGRVVTVTGPPGAGKTALARAMVRIRAERSCVVVWCELGQATTLGEIIRVTAAATRAPIEGRVVVNDIHTLASWLTRFDAVVLDNGEECVGALAEVIRAWCASTAIVVTSRIPLGVPEETRIELGGLPAEAARALFARTAEAMVDGLLLGPEADETVARIVDRLDRLPLAILLTAGHLGVFERDALLARLDHPLSLLESSRRDLPERHRTLRLALERSWELLSPPPRAVLAALSAFPASFGLDAAEAVFEAPAGDVLRAVHSGLDASLLRTVVGEDGPRVAMFEIVRDYADEQLTGGARAEAFARHGTWAVGIAESLVATLHGPGATGALHQLSSLVPDLVAATERGLAPRVTVRAALAAHAILSIRGPFEQHLALLDRAVDLARAEVPDLLAVALSARGTTRDHSGLTADADLAEALALARRDGDRDTAADCLFYRCEIANRHGRLVAGSDALREVFESVSESTDPRRVARAQGQLGWVLCDQQDPAGARRELTAACASLARIGDVHSEVYARGRLGLALRILGDEEEAEANFREALRLAEQVGAVRLTALTLAQLGALLRDRGDDAAVPTLQLAVDGARSIGATRLAFACSTEIARALLARDPAAALAVLEPLETTDPWLLPQLQYIRARTLRALGRADEALALADAIDLVPERDHEICAFVTGLRAVLLLERGDIAAAAAAVALPAHDELGSRVMEIARALVVRAGGGVPVLGPPRPYDHISDIQWLLDLLRAG
jgi:predicted ATPase